MLLDNRICCCSGDEGNRSRAGKSSAACVNLRMVEVVRRVDVSQNRRKNMICRHNGLRGIYKKTLELDSAFG